MNRQSPIVVALEQFELERANMLARLTKLDNLIAQTREVFHLPNGKPARVPMATATPAAANNNGHGNTDELDATDTAILSALKGGPMTPGNLAAKLEMERPAVRYRVKQLEAAGLLVSTGATATRQIALAGKPAKEAPQR
jgi:biotin operon repressor